MERGGVRARWCRTESKERKRKRKKKEATK
jgi:hypothetical protein